jgi:hypothetical protein
LIPSPRRSRTGKVEARSSVTIACVDPCIPMKIRLSGRYALIPNQTRLRRSTVVGCRDSSDFKLPNGVLSFVQLRHRIDRLGGALKSYVVPPRQIRPDPILVKRQDGGYNRPQHSRTAHIFAGITAKARDNLVQQRGGIISDSCVWKHSLLFDPNAHFLKLQSSDARSRPAFRQRLNAGRPSAANLLQKSPSPNLRGTEVQRIESRGSFRIG